MPVSVARVRTYMKQSQKGLARHTVRTTDDVAWSRIMSSLVLSWSVLSNLVYLENTACPFLAFALSYPIYEGGRHRIQAAHQEK